MVAGIFHILPFVCANQGHIMSTHLLHMQQLAVLIIATALLHAYATDIVDNTSRRCLPAIAGDKGMAVGILAVVPQGRNLLLEVLALNHIGVAPCTRGIQRLVGSLIVYQIDIVRQLVVDIVHFLHTLEYLVVVHRYVGNVGVGEGRSATADATPRSTAAIVNHHRFLASLGKIAEQRATRNTAAGNQHLHMLLCHIVHLREHKHLLGLGVIQVAQGHLVRQRRTRRGVAHQLYAIAAQNLTRTRDAAFATAGTHTQSGDMLQLVHRDGLPVAQHLQHSVQLDILAVAHVCLALHRLHRLHHQRLGIAVFHYKALDVGHHRVAAHLHSRHMGLIRFLQYLLNHTLAYLGTVVVHQIHLGTLLRLIFYRQEADTLLHVVAKDSQARAVAHALHTADTLVVIHRRCGICRRLGDSPLRAAERARIAGKAIQAVHLHKRFHPHALLARQVGFL